MASAVETVVSKVIAILDSHPLARRGAVAVMVMLALGAAGYFGMALVPRPYSLTITGGEIIGNRHFVAKVLQEEARGVGVTLKVKPTQSTDRSVEMLATGELDLALVQGGLDAFTPNVVHVATLAPEVLHFLVRPDIKSVGDIRGRSINMGNRTGGTRVVARQVLDASGLEEGVDFVETNYGGEELLTMRSERLPDVVVDISFVPSQMADYLVKERGFRVLELPFPDSLALRLGWVADGRIPGYMYSVSPPVPPADIRTIGVNLHLLANAKVDPKAIEKLLEVLYGPTIENRLKMRFNEATITLPSGFPLSAGTQAFLKRSEPLLSKGVFDHIKSALGLLATLVSAAFVVMRAVRAGGTAIEERFKGHIRELASLEHYMRGIGPSPDLQTLLGLEARLSDMKERALTDSLDVRSEDSAIVDRLLDGIADCRARLAPQLAAATTQRPHAPQAARA